MDWYRLKHTLCMYLTGDAVKRAEYIKKHDIFYSMGNNCMVMFRKIPLYPKLISFGNNVWIASNVTFITHDVIHYMLNYKARKEKFQEHLGCIKINDNCFIGADTAIVGGVEIGPNVIVGAGSLINKDMKEGVYAGVPARYICSFEEYTKKREEAKEPELVRAKGGLADSTVEAYWKLFSSKREEARENGRN